jgi:hypothetical protein
VYGYEVGSPVIPPLTRTVVRAVRIEFHASFADPPGLHLNPDHLTVRRNNGGEIKSRALTERNEHRYVGVHKGC